MVKNLSAGSTPGSARSPEGGHGNPLRYSCLENHTDRGAWRATKNWGLKELNRTLSLSFQAQANCPFVVPASQLPMPESHGCRLLEEEGST